MFRSRSGYLVKAVILFIMMFSCSFFSGCGCGDDGGGSAVTTITDSTGQQGSSAKQLIIEGPIPNDISESTTISFAGSSSAQRAAEFGDGKQFVIAVIDRDDPTLVRELAPVVISTSENALYKYKYTTTITITPDKKSPFIVIKSKILNKVMLSSIPGKVPAYSEVPKDVRKIYLRGALINSESTARAVLALDKKLEINVPIVAISPNEESQEIVIRELTSTDKTPADSVIENNVGGIETIREMAKAIDAIKKVVVTGDITEADKRSIFENTREKNVVPSAAGVISDYVLTLKNSRVQEKAGDLDIATSIELAGTKIDGRSTVAVVDGSARNAAGVTDDAPPSVTSVTISPKSIKVGDELQLAFTTSKLLIFPPKVTIYEREVVTTKIDGTTYVATTTVRETDPKDVGFKIDNLVGENGKTAPPVTTTTDGKKTKIEDGITDVHAPVFDPPTGVYKMAKVVTMYTKTAGSQIRYTTDGSEPSANGGTIFEAPFTVTADTTVKAVAIKGGIASSINQALYVINKPSVKVEAPLFSFSGGNFSKAQNIEIKSLTEGVTIKYTIDGSIPSKTNGLVYSSPIIIDKQIVLKAIAVKDGMDDSNVTSAVYDVNIATESAPSPVFNPAAGSFISKQSIVLVSAVNDVLIKYTTDGTIPSYTNGFIYKEPIMILEPTTVKAVAIKDGMMDSEVVTGVFDVNIVGPVPEIVAEPVFSPAGGKYTNYSQFYVKLITQVRGAVIVYTTDGSTPTSTNGEMYTAPFRITKSTTVKAVAIKNKMVDSPVVSALYEIKNDFAPPAPPIILGVKEGAISPEDVTLSWNEQEGVSSSAKLIKDDKSLEYSKNVPVKEEGSYTLEVSVKKTANNASNKASVAFSIDRTVPEVPVIIGVNTGEVSAKPLSLFWEDPAKTKCSAKLVKNNGLKSDYIKGYEIAEDGEYTLELTATSDRNGLTAEAKISFAINSKLPEVPLVTGVYDKSKVASDVTLSWEEVQGVTLTAKLIKDNGEAIPYTKKTAIAAEGSYKLILEAKKDDSGTINSRAIEFVIDKTEPAAPVITGITEGTLTAAEVKLSWEESKDVRYISELTRDEGRPDNYLKNSLIAADGKYTLTVTAIKPNGLKKASRITFTIDRNAPDAPVISVTDNGKGASVINWNEQDGNKYSAKLIKDNGEAVDYVMGTPVNEKGVYAVTVTVVRIANNVSNKASANFNRLFTDLVVGPKAVDIIGVENNAVVGQPVTLDWKAADGTETAARIKKGNGEFVPYTKGALISEEGIYIVEVEITDTFTKLTSKSFITFTINKTAPVKPVITGINEGAITASEVKITWNEQEGVETYAKLIRNSILDVQNDNNNTFNNSNMFSRYEKSSSISEEGSYIIEVVAKKLSNGMTSSSKISFTIDRTAPAKPVITGIDNRAFTASNVTLSWNSINGVVYSAKLIKNQNTAIIYEKNTVIPDEGSYVLEVKATKSTNGLSSVSMISFTINKTVPEAPVVKGLKDGDEISGTASASWDEKQGFTTTATLSKDGGDPVAYKSGDPITAEGSYILVITVKNNITAVTNVRTINFTIDNKFPEAVHFTGVKEGQIYGGTVNVSWKEQEKAFYESFVTVNGGKPYTFVKGSPLSATGNYSIKVIARKHNGLIKESVVNFEIDAESPQVPVVRYIDKGNGVSVLTWNEQEGVTAAAKIRTGEGNEIDYAKDTPVTVAGETASFNLTITALKNRNGLSSRSSMSFTRTPAGFDAGPEYPIIKGINNGGYYNKTVSASWDEANGVSYYAKLVKGEDNISLYNKNAAISADGAYILEVVAVKALNGMKNKAVVSFRIDTAMPPAPVITGVKAEETAINDVILDWKEASGVLYSATISKDGAAAAGYGKGSLISSTGKYFVEVTATKLANGGVSKSNIAFAIDKDAPEAPVVSGIEEGSTTPKDVVISWKLTGTGLTSSATISRNGGQSAAIQNGATVSEDGSYIVEVTAVRTSNNRSSKITRKFTINKSLPSAAVITGVSEGTSGSNAVTATWNEQEGVSSSAVLYRNGQPVQYSKNTQITDEGEYILEVAVVKNSNGLSNGSRVKFRIDKTVPAKPVIKGISQDEVTAGPVKIYWEEQQWTGFTAKISRNNGLKSDYVSNFELSEEGSYALEVTAKNERSGLEAKSPVSFKIDRTLPGMPVITGITDGSISNNDIDLSWNELTGVTVTAKISRNGGQEMEFLKGTRLTEDGSYVLVITSKKNSTGVTAVKTIKFTIDKGAPQQPAITGINNGATSASAVKLSWNEQEGVTYKAELSKDGGKPEIYSRNSAVAENGNFTLAVTASKPNGLTAEAKISFKIDKNAPDVPVVTVTDKDGASYVSWNEQEGVRYAARIAKEGGSAADYAKNTAVKEKGNYIVTVIATRISNNAETKASVAFNRESMQILVAPEPPQIRGVEDGAVAGVNVSLTWQDITSVVTTGRIKKTGGEFKEYQKGSAIIEDGSYTFELEAKEPKTNMSSKRTITFTIDKKAPSAPVLSGIKDGEVAGGEIKVLWNDQDGCETTARLTKSGEIKTQTTVTQNNNSNSGMDMNMMDMNMMDMINNASYFYRDYYGRYFNENNMNLPYNPGYGGYNYNFNNSYVRLEDMDEKARLYYMTGNSFYMMERMKQYLYEQSMKQSNESVTTTNIQKYLEASYEKNSLLAEKGEYILEVVAHKKYNGLKASTKVKFTIDPSGPEAPVLTGVNEGTTTSSNVTVLWEKAKGVNYLAKLIKDATLTLLYESGSPITLEGSYSLEVTATNQSNGKSATSTKKFKIDRSVPAVPEIKGITNGASTASDVVITWDAAEGTTVTAKYIKDNGAAAEFKKGDKLTNEGNYSFEVTVKNTTTGAINKKTIYFSIDKKAPEAPVISGVQQDMIYSDSVKASWNTKNGITYKAYVIKDESGQNDYTNGLALIADGNYTIKVVAEKSNGLTGETSVKFTIDRKGPDAPAVDIIDQGGGKTIITWNEQEGCQSVAKLSRNAGESAEYYKETVITEDGKYVIEVTAHKAKNGMKNKTVLRFNRTPAGLDAGPQAPKVIGVTAGTVYSNELTIAWEEQQGVTYYALLTRGEEKPVEITNGMKLSANGLYKLEIVAKKTLNGMTNKTSLSFTIDMALPEAPVIEGIEANGISVTDLRLKWKEVPGAFYSATIVKDNEQSVSYGNGFPITLNGKYLLEVTAAKLSNNLKSKSSIEFTIDKTPPEEPVISGVENGAIIPDSVTITWTEKEGVKTSAIIYRNGGNPQPVTNRSAISADGAYKIEVTAVKTVNKLQSKSVRSFTINKSMPSAPSITGVEESKVFNSAVIPSWNEQTGITTKAKLSKDQADAIEFVKGTPVALSGKYKLVVTASGNNGLSNSSAVSFTLDLTSPVTPAITVTTKDNAMIATWIEEKEYAYSAKLAKQGGLASDYIKESPITEDGSYVLELTITKISNGLSNKTSINFTKAGTKVENGPKAPEVTGVANGKFYNSAVKPSWNDVTGTTVAATIMKLGGQPAEFVKGSGISEDGNYILEVTSTGTTNKLTSKTVVSFVIDTTAPSAVLIYSANPAGEGAMRITASYSEILAKGSVPRISIDQPGTTDIKSVVMTQDASSPANWYYDYFVKMADNAAYSDGVAIVTLSEISDIAGNVSNNTSNTNFIINTSAPMTSINYSFVPSVPQPQQAADHIPITIGGSNITIPGIYTTGNPADTTSINFTNFPPTNGLPGNTQASNVFRTGKLTIIITFTKDVKQGAVPAISIDQSGSSDITNLPMTIGNSRRIWTYDYTVSADNGQAFIDGKAAVTISQTMDEVGKIFAQPSNRNFTIDTKEPTVQISYSSNPAPAGKLTITAKYSEPLKAGFVPYLSIFQQGSYELTDVSMTKGIATDIWTYEYMVGTPNSQAVSEFKEGKAMIFLSSVTDEAGNISKRPANQTFLIGSSVKNYATLSFSANPTKAGKMTITATFKEDYTGQNAPRISIEQPGKADVQQKFMSPGASKKIWTFDYVINDNNGADFMDGIATVGLMDDKMNPIDIIGNNTFVIDTTPPVVTLQSLNDAGQKLAGGTTYTIKWSASDSGGLDPKPITITFYNGINTTTIETGLANTGSYEWKVPSVDINTAKISVSAVDTVGNRGTASSQNAFAITSSGPAWSAGYPKLVSTTTNTASLSAKSDITGKLYFICILSSANLAAIPPASVKIGTAGTGVTVAASGALAITANTELPFEAKNLAASTSYDIFVVIEDSKGVIQNGAQKITAKTNMPNFSSGYPKAVTVTSTSITMAYKLDVVNPDLGFYSAVAPSSAARSLTPAELKTLVNTSPLPAGWVFSTGATLPTDAEKLSAPISKLTPGTQYDVFSIVTNGRTGEMQAATTKTTVKTVAGPPNFGTGTDNTVYAINFDAAGNMYIGGDFAKADTVAASKIAKYSGGTWSALGSGANSSVKTIAFDSRGMNLYAGGDFYSAGGASNTSNIAIWNGTGWTSVPSGPFSGGVYAINIVKNQWGSEMIYAGGRISMIGSKLMSAFVKYESSNGWFSPGGQAFGSGSVINATAVDNSGNIFVAGQFTSGGGLNTYNIVKWGPYSWSSLSSGLYGTVYSLVIDSKGVLYAGGTFGVSKWDGYTWTGLSGIQGTVYSLAIDSNGNVYAGGMFPKAGALTVNNLAKWNGTSWSAVGTGVTGTGYVAVFALKISPQGDLIVGGKFSTAFDKPANNISLFPGVSAPIVINLPPVWSAEYPKVVSTTSSTANLSARSDKSGKLYYICVQNTGSIFGVQPSEVKAGVLNNGIKVVSSAFVPMTADTESSFEVKNLSPNTDYDFYAVMEDSTGLMQYDVKKVSAKTLVPVMTVSSTSFASGYPKSQPLDDMQNGPDVRVTVKTTQPGKVHVVMFGSSPTARAAAPSAYEIKTGTFERQYLVRKSVSIEANTEASVDLTLNTEVSMSRYYFDIYAIAEDTAGNFMAAPVKIDYVVPIPSAWAAYYDFVSFNQIKFKLSNSSIESAGTVYYVCLPYNGGAAPTALQIKNGQNASGSPVTAEMKGSMAVTAPASDIPVTINGLVTGTAYIVYFCGEDKTSGRLSYPSSYVPRNNVTFNSGYPAFASADATSMTFKLSLSSPCNVYYVAIPASVSIPYMRPTPEEVKAGVVNYPGATVISNGMTKYNTANIVQSPEMSPESPSRIVSTTDVTAPIPPPPVTTSTATVIKGLTAKTSYNVYMVAEVNGWLQSYTTKVSAATTAVRSTMAFYSGYPKAGTATATSIPFVVKLDRACTLYYICAEASRLTMNPSPEEIKNASVANLSSSFILSKGSFQYKAHAETISNAVTNLSGGTSYKIFIVGEDTTGLQAIPGMITATTAAPLPTATPEFKAGFPTFKFYRSEGPRLTVNANKNCTAYVIAYPTSYRAATPTVSQMTSANPYNPGPGMLAIGSQSCTANVDTVAFSRIMSGYQIQSYTSYDIFVLLYDTVNASQLKVNKFTIMTESVW